MTQLRCGGKSNNRDSANCPQSVPVKELVQESPADARFTRAHHSEMVAVPRWRSGAILDIIELEIAPFDPPTPKTLA